MKRSILMGLSFVAVLMLASAASAQQPAWMSAEPLYWNNSLTTGFTPDPVEIEVQAGGSEAATVLGAPAECAGMITSGQPDVRLNYTAGEVLPLRFYVVSDADTTLVVNDANGNWHCNDDSMEAGAGLNPVVQIDSPPTGQYDVWVGVWGAADVQPAKLYISEMTSSGPASH
jgi:hypothetical protein